MVRATERPAPLTRGKLLKDTDQTADTEFAWTTAPISEFCSPHRRLSCSPRRTRRNASWVCYGEVAGEVGHAVWTWSTTSGLVNADGQRMYRTENPHQALAWIQDLTAPAVFVFVDAHPILSDAYVVRRIKETAQKIQPHQTLVFTAPSHEVPPELSSEARRLETSAPG